MLSSQLKWNCATTVRFKAEEDISENDIKNSSNVLIILSKSNRVSI